MTGRPYLLILSVLSWPAGTALAQPAAPPHIAIDREVGTHKELSLEVGQNRLLILSEQIVRVSVAEPKVADLKVITPTQLLLTAKGVGATDLTLWNRRDDPFVISLRVGRNLEALRKQLKELFPQETINVTAAGDLVVLSGEVGDVRVPERAAEVAKLHAERLTNLIHVRGNQQVQLEVRFAEVSRKGLRAMAFNVFHQDSLGRFVGGVSGAGSPLGGGVSVPGTGTAGMPQVPAPGAAGAFNIFFSGLPRFPFSAVVSLLESTGLAKILAEPTLVAMSGQEARFLAGGEFPIPMTSGLGALSVNWKRFGIILNFTPTVIDEGTIHLKLMAEVSDVDPARGISVGGVVIPGVSSRQSETTVRLGDGQSFAIAGLLSNRIRHNVDKIPLLGDLPILGALFRSVSYQRDESELLVVVTARLARPLAPHEVPPLPTDYEMNDPGDLELFLLGGEGRRPPKSQGQGQGQGQGKEESAPQAAPTERASVRRGPSGELGFIR